MSPGDENASGSAESGSPESDNPEEVPVAVLNDFEEDVSSDFVPRLRRRLHRRIFSGQVTQFSFSVPGMLLMEFLHLIFGFLPQRKSGISNAGSSNSSSTAGTAPPQENRP